MWIYDHGRYESGLDNSPMYDGDYYNDTDGCSLTEDGCGLMQLCEFRSSLQQPGAAASTQAPFAAAIMDRWQDAPV